MTNMAGIMAAVSQAGIVLKKIMRAYFLIDKLEVERERQEMGILWRFESQSSPQ